MKSELIPMNATVHHDPRFSRELGPSAAIILARIIWSINQKIKTQDSKYFHDGKYWMYDSVNDLCQHLGLTRRIFYTALKKLTDETRIVNVEKIKNKTLDPLDRRNHYSINMARFLAVFSDCNKMSQCIDTRCDNALPQDVTVDCDKMSQCIDTGCDNPSLSKSPSKSRSKNLSVLREVPSPEDLEIAKSWLAYAKREMSWTEPPASWIEEKFAADIVKLKSVTNLNFEGLKSLLNFIENDSFWVKNALSPGSLLKKSKNDNLKINNILMQMKPSSDRLKENLKRWSEEPIEESPFIF